MTLEESLIKGPERERRRGRDGIHLALINETTPFVKQLKKLRSLAITKDSSIICKT